MKSNSNIITKLTKVSDIEIPDRFFNRMKSGIEKIDELFGGGILPGLTFTLTGVAGAGKSSALLQILNALALSGKRVAYLTGEEDLRQVAFNCRRLGVEDVLLSNETDIDKIKAIARESDIVVIDSFPCITTTVDLPKEKREKLIIDKIINYCDEFECAIGMILHLTKSGQYKGSTYIPHAVGANFQIDLDPDLEEYRMIGSSKNRYGPTKQFSFLFGHGGFEFDQFREIDRAPAKSNDKAHEKQVMDLVTEHLKVSKSQVIEELNITSSKAYTILKSLTESKALEKQGRGDNAMWVIPKAS
jgi:predicted ATP-dependent serine protease